MNITKFDSSYTPQLKHLLGIEKTSQLDLEFIISKSLEWFYKNKNIPKKFDILRGKTQINLFFEPSTRTQSSFELAGKRLGADVINMSLKQSSVTKGETLIDTAVTLNAMKPDLLIVRHQSAGAAELLSQKVDCSVVNAGDGSHEHPTQAILDTLTILHHKKRIEGLKIAICGDILHSRVARSNILMLSLLGANINLVAPTTLLPRNIDKFKVNIYNDMREGIKNVDVIMMLRLQNERMLSSYIPSAREYFRYYGLDEEKLSIAKNDAIVMHPGPMNRGVEIDTSVADNVQSVIKDQVEMGVAARMAILEILSMR
jgi:aspartate carbamoyltransferase catalytic subunit